MIIIHCANENHRQPRRGASHAAQARKTVLAPNLGVEIVGSGRLPRLPIGLLAGFRPVLLARPAFRVAPLVRCGVGPEDEPLPVEFEGPHLAALRQPPHPFSVNVGQPCSRAPAHPSRRIGDSARDSA